MCDRRGKAKSIWLNYMNVEIREYIQKCRCTNINNGRKTWEKHIYLQTDMSKFRLTDQKIYAHTREPEGGGGMDKGGRDDLPTFMEVPVILPFFEKKWAKNAIKIDFFGYFWGQNFKKIFENRTFLL